MVTDHSSRSKKNTMVTSSQTLSKDTVSLQGNEYSGLDRLPYKSMSGQSVFLMHRFRHVTPLHTPGDLHSRAKPCISLSLADAQISPK